MTKNSPKVRLYRYWYIVLIPILGLIFFFISVKIVNTIDYHNSDFFTFWLAGHLATLGQNPYLSDIWIGGHHQFGVAWIPNTTFIYPLPLAFFFAPLGLLSVYQAFIVWGLLLQYMISLSVFLLLRSYPFALVKRFLLPLLAGVVIFRPTIVTLLNGQLGGFLLIVIVSIIALWENGKWRQGAILLPILALKPNLGVPIILLLSLFLIMQKKYSAVFAGGISGLVLLLSGFTQNSNWILEFLRAGNLKLSQTFGFSPTVWGISTFICNKNLNCFIITGSILSLFFLAAYIFLLAKKQRELTPTLVIGLAIAIMLLITPYTWAYDQVLLIAPIIALTMSIGKVGYRFMPTALIFLGIDVLALIILMISARIQLDIWSVTIPLSVFLLFAWYLSKNKPVSQIKDAI